MIRGRSTVVCSTSVFLWQAENSSRSPSDSWNTLKPRWNLWQKLLFLLAFENHLLFLGLGHLLFRLMVKHFLWELLGATRNTECSALARSRNIACVTGTERGGAGTGGGGEKREGKMEYQERNIYWFRPPRCLQITIINGFWAQYCK